MKSDRTQVFPREALRTADSGFRFQVSAKIVILFAAALIIALPFIFRRHETTMPSNALDLVIVTPQNEAIRYEFGRAFSKWHEAQFGKPVRVDWRAIGGTTEISRYLCAEFVNAARAWWKGQGFEWPAGASEKLLDGKFAATNNDAMSQLWKKFRDTDDPKQFSARADLFFGGGEYDHSILARQGLTVAPWPAGREPANLFFAANGTPLIPEKIGGEVWRTPTLFGCTASSFGICYNLDRLRDLGVTNQPARWDDLGDPVYFRQIGISDPTKSGSIAKAFELIVHQKCQQAVHAAGFTETQIDAFEKSPSNAPAAYQKAVEDGWHSGLALLQRIGANARYFTDSASKVPVDVGMGNCAAGLCIDFYGRFEAQHASAPDGSARMAFVVPVGGSSATADPVSLLRGAEHRELAVRFIEFALSEDGQKIWCYKPGTPGGPEKYALRRVPIRRDFFPSDDPAIKAKHLEYLKYSADNLADPQIDPYLIAGNFHYHAGWTGKYFGLLRDFVKVMCIDSSAELQNARSLATRLPEPKRSQLMTDLFRYPPNPLDGTPCGNNYLLARDREDRMETLRIWTEYYRAHYRAVAAATAAAR